MAMANATHAAVRPLNRRNGATGINAPTAVDTPVNHPSLNGVACASPIFSSSRTCSSSARCESRINSAAILRAMPASMQDRSEEHTSELQSQSNLVCRLLLEKKKKKRHALLLSDTTRRYRPAYYRPPSR